MTLPFTVDQFFGVFARYNDGVWPAQWALHALALGALALVFRDRPSSGRWVAAILALLWGWTALAYHLAYFSRINPAAWAFGALSLAGALGFAWVGVVHGRLRFAPSRGLRGGLGGALVAFALVVYPALGHALGHRYPAVPTFGLPCPTTIFSIGLLLFAQPPVPRSLFVVPLLWALVGSTAAFALGVAQDLSLLVAAAVALLALVRPSALFGVAPPARAKPVG